MYRRKNDQNIFSSKGVRAKEPLELIHTDICGPMNVQAQGGYEYYVTFNDDYSRYVYVYLMQRKSETFEKFKDCEAELHGMNEREAFINGFKLAARIMTEVLYEPSED